MTAGFRIRIGVKRVWRYNKWQKASTYVPMMHSSQGKGQGDVMADDKWCPSDSMLPRLDRTERSTCLSLLLEEGSRSSCRVWLGRFTGSYCSYRKTDSFFFLFNWQSTRRWNRMFPSSFWMLKKGRSLRLQGQNKKLKSVFKTQMQLFGHTVSMSSAVFKGWHTAVTRSEHF